MSVLKNSRVVRYFYALVLITIVLLPNTWSSVVYQHSLIETDSSTNEYVIEKKWSLFLNTTYRSLFRTGDFNRDGFEELVVISNKTLYIVNGFNGSVFREISFDKVIVGFIPIRDLDNDGFNEVVVVTGDFTEVNMTREFIVWNVRENKVMRRNSISIEIGYYHLEFDHYRLITYRENTVEYVFPYVLFTEAGFKPISYVIIYNVSTNSIEYKIVDNVSYLMYRTILYGDIDNDGVNEFTTRYFIEQYSEGLSLRESRYKLVIREGNREFFSNLSRNFVFDIEVSYTKQHVVLLMEVLENKTIDSRSINVYRIIAVNNQGKFLYEKKYVNAFGKRITMGDLFTVLYFDEESNETRIELINTTSGYVVAKTILSKSTIFEYAESYITITGLGDIDNDNVKEFFVKHQGECIVFKTNEYLTKTSLGNCSIDKVVSILKTINGVYLVTTRNTSISLEIEAFNIYKPGVKPVIGSVPLPYEEIVVKTTDSAIEYFILLVISIVIVILGVIIYVRFKSIKIKKRVVGKRRR